jgi:hypothetical protein
MRLEEETRDNAEVAATTADRPKQIRVLALAGGHHAAIGEDDVGFEQVIDCQAVLTCEITRAATKRQSRGTRRRDDPDGTARPNACVA